MTDGSWLDDKQAKGDATMGMGTMVKPDQLKKFSTQATEESQTFTTNFSGGFGNMVQAGLATGAGFYEAEQFFHRAAGQVDRIGQFVADATYGLLGLGSAASTISINYLNADATQAAGVNDVNSVFDYENASRTLRGLAAENGEVAPAVGQDDPIPLPEGQTDIEVSTESSMDDGAETSQTINLANGDTYTTTAAAPGDAEVIPDTTDDTPDGDDGPDGQGSGIQDNTERLGTHDSDPNDDTTGAADYKPNFDD